MTKRILFSLAIAIGSLYACQDNHLISNAETRKEVSQRFQERIKQKQPHDHTIDSILALDLSQEKREAFEFLYAFMPLSDFAMHTGNYVLRQVESVLDAKQSFAWGKAIPSEIFLHFVLPYRVNNEYTDTARQLFLQELKPRLKGLSMYDAALEVNHWCHEKVIYKATDARTSGPLTTVRTAFGRCGEESTFAVCALRSVGIPARQVYTPRWAHTDDNHAWVEVWIDGKWHFLGACEPEPELDMAWFASPVKRAMMARTFVFGKYNGPEEVLNQTEWYSEINLTPNYAPTKKTMVTVCDEKGKPINGVKVAFKQYNYAEFYPLAVKETDAEGCCSLISGKGDLIVWASKDNKIGFAKADAIQENIRIMLSEKPVFADTIFTVVPPPEIKLDAMSDAKVDENNRRLHEEDSIRNLYIATFIDSAAIDLLQQKTHIDRKILSYALQQSRGNWSEIKHFFERLSPTEIAWGVMLVSELAEKDLHDITSDILYDHLQALQTIKWQTANEKLDSNIFKQYVLSPRIEREYITSWRSHLQKHIGQTERLAMQENPQKVMQWLHKTITIDSQSNYYNVRMSPESVILLKTADPLSLKVCFVACCRSIGIASRIEASTGRPQYYWKKQWIDALHSNPESTTPAEENVKGKLSLKLPKNSLVEKPQYYTHYTIARLERGSFQTLDFETDPAMNNLPATISLDTGVYRLMSGNRQVDGSVKCQVTFFHIQAHKTTDKTLQFNNSGTANRRLYGMININTALQNTQQQSIGIIDHYLGQKPLIIALIDPHKEPTRHFINDLAAVKESLQQWGGNIILAVAKDKLPTAFRPSDYTQLPKQTLFAYDPQQQLNNAIATACSKAISTDYPILMVIKSKGEIVFYSEGYSIGLGEQLLKILNQ